MPVTRSQKSYAVKRTTDETSAVSMTRSADATQYASASGATTGGTSGPQPPSEPTTETLPPPLLPPCAIVAGATTAVAPTAAVSTEVDSVESTSTKQGRLRLPSSSRSTASSSRRKELAQARLEALEKRKRAAEANAQVAIIAAKAKAEAATFDADLAAAKVAMLEEDSEEEQIEPDDETIKEARTSEWVRKSTLAVTSQDVVACEVPPEHAGNVVASRVTPNSAGKTVACQVLTEPAGPGCHAERAAITEDPRSVHHAQEKPTNVRAIEPAIVKQDYQDLAAAIGSAVARSIQPISTVSARIVELPNFNGASSDWLPFKRAFEESEYQLSEQENLARLRKSLRGLARDAVHCLFVGSTTAREVMELLEARFGRPEAIAIAELNKLRSLPKLSANPSDICVFASKVINVTATIRALENPQHLCNAEVVRTVVEKMPPAVQFQYYKFNKEQPKGQPNLITLANFFKLMTSEVGEFAPAEIISAEDRREPHSRKPQRSYHVTDTSMASNTLTTCPVCKQEHSITDCTKMKKASVQERWNLAKTHKLCFRCLRVRRFRHICKLKRCDINGCRSSHHPMLHDDIAKTTHSETTTVNAVTTTKTVEKVNNVSGLLKILPVQVSGPKGVVDTFALLDDGSTCTIIESATAEKIGAEGPTMPLIAEGVGGAQIRACDSRRVRFHISGRNTERREITARTMDNLNLSPQAVPRRVIQDCPHLQGLESLLLHQNGKPTILVGQDNWDLLLAHELRSGDKSQPVASRTELGWVLHGVSQLRSAEEVHRISHIQNHQDETMEVMMKEHFALESLGVEPKRSYNDTDRRALQLLEDNTKSLPAGGYETRLLWKDLDYKPPNNYESALRRLELLEKKLDKNADLKRRYKAQLQVLIDQGYAERAPETKPERLWYLPHFPVINPQKPEKLRIVHDAAAKTRGISLNDMLLSGPDMLQSLPGVLMRLP
ncbi:uncharacterized protein LOC125490208 [Plutella xylostella]|uniref:uncharacterized protein LOC125490208 n=1 Tax=Plutella xylostella TaxID=51655 RepID=UPI002033197A|nr:uncharacterized protein LOC125490208 [Plutella xylostella]